MSITYLQFGEFMRFIASVFRVDQLGEEELFELGAVPKYCRIGQRRTKEGHVVSGSHTHLIPVPLEKKIVNQ